MWKIVDTFEMRNLRWPESELDLVFKTREMAQAFIDLNLDEGGRFQPRSEEQAQTSPTMAFAGGRRHA
jgi:hypothetical protein